jgi:hypothetical protein
MTGIYRLTDLVPMPVPVVQAVQPLRSSKIRSVFNRSRGSTAAFRSSRNQGKTPVQGFKPFNRVALIKSIVRRQVVLKYGEGERTGNIENPKRKPTFYNVVKMVQKIALVIVQS